MFESVFLACLIVFAYMAPLFYSEPKKKIKTICTSCSRKADNEPIGNGCYTCLIGKMEIPDPYTGLPPRKEG